MTTLSRLLDLAYERQRQLDATAQAAAGKVVRNWSAANPAELELEWSARAPEIAAIVASAQVAAARQATPYVEASAALQGSSAAGAVVVAESFAGVTTEGRELGPELYSGVTYTKRLIGGGMGIPAAFRAGAVLMSILAANTIRDAGRSADKTGSAAKGFTRSVRVVQPGACSRCAILAGVTGYRTNFDRHPGCRCTSMAIADDAPTPDGFFESPEDYFESLSKAEQDRVFSKAGAEAVRMGASPIRVVNARRSAVGVGYSSAPLYPHRIGIGRMQKAVIGRKADGSSILGYVTDEGTTKRGVYGSARRESLVQRGGRYRRTENLRLMPETILSLTDDVALRGTLLRDAGYIEFRVRDMSTNNWIRERAAERAADRAVATEFYRSLGISS